MLPLAQQVFEQTPLQPLASGIYNHVPGDGREHLVVVPDTVGPPFGRVACAPIVRRPASPGIGRNP